MGLKVAYCGGIWKKSSGNTSTYQSPHKSNVNNITSGSSFSSQKNLTDADAYIFEKTDSGSATLHIFKSPCSPRMLCTYKENSYNPYTKIINNNDNIWCKIVDGKQIVMADYGSFEEKNKDYRIGSYERYKPYSGFATPTSVEFYFINKGDDIPTSTNPYMFQGCIYLTSCNVPCQMRTISPYTFANCSSLSSYTENPDFIGKIDDAAFSGCSGLEEIVIGKNASLSGGSNFSNCTSASTITWNNLSNSDVKLNMTTIPSQAFYNCSSLANTKFANSSLTQNAIVIPSGITLIGSSAFENCTRISELDLRSVSQIDSRAFMNCTSLSAITGLENVTTIGSEAFKNSIITNLTIASGATLGDGSFAFCKQLSAVTFNSGVTISASCFEECTSLTDIRFKDAINVPSNAFKNCSGLTSVTFKNSSSIYYSGFTSCNALTDVYADNKVTRYADSFSTTPKVHLAYTAAEGSTETDWPEWVTYYKGNNWDECEIVDTNNKVLFAKDRTTT